MAHRRQPVSQLPCPLAQVQQKAHRSAIAPPRGGTGARGVGAGAQRWATRGVGVVAPGVDVGVQRRAVRGGRGSAEVGTGACGRMVRSVLP
jgi:hypothetical protein